MTDVRTLSTDELRQRLEQEGELQFWNVLTDKYFNGEMIPGSRRVPLDAIEQNTAGLSKGAEIITYCGGPQCPQSTQAARKLSESGYTNVRAYEEGVEGWKAAGHSIDRVQEPTPQA